MRPGIGRAPVVGFDPDPPRGGAVFGPEAVPVDGFGPEPDPGAGLGPEAAAGAGLGACGGSSEAGAGREGTAANEMPSSSHSRNTTRSTVSCSCGMSFWNCASERTPSTYASA